MNIDEIIALLQSGSLTKEQQDEIWKTIKADIGNKNFNKSADLQAKYDAVFKTAMQSPQGRQFFEDKLRDTKAQAFTKRYKPFFQAALQGADIATSISQIRAGNKASRELVRPTLPQSPGIDPAINQALYDAQQGNFQAMRALTPAQLQIFNAYQNDVNTARQVSGGQGASFQANVNAANLRRARAGAALPAIADSISARQDARADALLGVKQNALQQDFVNRQSNARLALDQFNLDAAAAGQLGQTGRINLRNTLGQVPDTALGIAGRMGPVYNPYSETVGDGAGLPTFAQAYGDKIAESYSKRLSQIKNAPIPYTRIDSPQMRQLRTRYSVTPKLSGKPLF